MPDGVAQAAVWALMTPVVKDETGEERPSLISTPNAFALAVLALEHESDREAEGLVIVQVEATFADHPGSPDLSAEIAAAAELLRPIDD